MYKSKINLFVSLDKESEIPHNKEDLHQLFFDLRDRLGQTFVIVTHDEGLAKITDRTVHMVDGTIKKD